MPRKPRVKSESQFYHVMLKGANSQLLFVDDEDRQEWVNRLNLYLGGFDNETELHAYCLMDNHIHMLLKDCNNSLDRVMKRLGVSYVLYFNTKYGRSGHLFNDRFRSEPVETDGYYLMVQRYIHQNPEKAGIDDTASYEWSSYKDFIKGKSSIVHTDMLLFMLGGVEAFVEYMEIENNDECLEISSEKIKDGDAIKVILGLGEIENLQEILGWRSEKQIKFAAMCKEMKLMKVQLHRLTGISRYYIDLAWKK